MALGATLSPETIAESSDFSRLYESHRQMCFSAALAVTCNRAWAEDAVHDGFMRIWQGREKYLRNAPEHVSALLVVAVRCAALNILRREGRLSHEPLDEHSFELADSAADTAGAAHGKDALTALRRLVAQLSETNRAVFEMKCLLGMSDRQVSQVLGLPVNAVATRFHRTRKALREKMAQEGYFDE